MAYSARDMQKVTSPSHERPRTISRGNVETLRRIAAEPVPPAFSRVVVAGVVRAIECGLIVMTGMTAYFAYVVRSVGQQPGYLPVTVAVSVMELPAVTEPADTPTVVVVPNWLTGTLPAVAVP